MTPEQWWLAEIAKLEEIRAASAAHSAVMQRLLDKKIDEARAYLAEIRKRDPTSGK